MPQLNLKPNHKAIRDYYATLQQYERYDATHEGAVSSPFDTLLHACAKQVNATLIPQYAMRTPKGNRIVLDGVILDEYGLPFAYWEAKDMHDDLLKAVQEKRDAGYPLENTFFQTPQRAIVYQNGQVVLDLDITEPARLIAALQYLFSYVPAALDNWHTAVADFRAHVPALASKLKELIDKQHQADVAFQNAFADFYQICRTSINPDLSQDAVEEMLIQHILTERIFRTVFERSDFTSRNIIASEIEKVSTALMRHAVSRDAFLKPLDRFYIAIEQAAMLCKDFSQKQHFLNTFYEKFFQGFSADVADTHGIVYTPQPIVDFMVNSVEHILKTEFDRSLSASGVHIIDPFVGTGNFIVRLMQELDPISLERKYTAVPPELQCNEVMLLPYYIASLNIEQQFYTATNQYAPFEGLCLVDTFEVAEARQTQLFTPANTERVEKQKQTPMFVVIGNPPYNAWQVNENDNNRNRKYAAMDKRIADTYAADSKATNKNALYDPYVKAIRWALDRIGEEGVVAFVTNNSFLDGIAFDGMRKHLAADCDAIYVLDLGGNMRKGLKVSHANVFDITVGVSINLFVKRKGNQAETPRIFYYRTDELWNKKDKFDFLTQRQHVGTIEWKPLQPDARHTWLTEGLRAEFDTFIPMGTKAAKAGKGAAVDVIFKTYSNGVKTCRDAWAYNFNRDRLAENVQRMVGTYNAEADRWKRREDKAANLDDFVVPDDAKIKWSSTLKRKLKGGKTAEFAQTKIRQSLYRPFTTSRLYFDRFMIDGICVFPSIFPTPETERENQVICLTDKGSEKPFMILMSNQLTDCHVVGPACGAQCFPFYTYDEDGTNRRENITEWALVQFRTHYQDDTISKWDIFHYNYGILHHPEYRERYQVNLKRDLPHIPFAKDFWGFAEAGAKLAALHVNYEDQDEYDTLKFIQTPNVPLNWRVEKMKLSKDKTSLVYNDFLTLDGIPAEAYQYRLGTRSALEWVVNQYCVKVDKRSGIKNDPNLADAPRYIVELIGRVINVSLKTVEVVKNLPAL